MIRECFRTGTGIMFIAEELQEIGMDPITLHPFVTPPLPRIHALRSDPVKKVHRASKRKDLKQKIMSWVSGNPIAMATPQEAVVQVSPIGTEAEEEHKDALSPRYDQLKLAPLWWILEYLPMEVRTRFADNWPITRVGYVFRARFPLLFAVF